CTGTSYPAINSNDLANIEVLSPAEKEEQQIIGSYFANLDHLITLHQRKGKHTIDCIFVKSTQTLRSEKQI
ncbi:MAG: hypothetical protein MR303_09940, partial [Emergencia sp.]|nr:hypothetical protein [Emergencia sp.]